MAEAELVVLFDGVCNFCNAWVNRLIRFDSKRKFRFAALQSPAGQRLLKDYGLPAADFESFIFLDQGRAYKKSTAVLRIAHQLGWKWKWAQIFRLVPRLIRDWVYDTIAHNRYKWFGRREDCMIPTPGVKARFLDA